MLTNVDLVDLEIKTQFGLKMKVGGDFSQFCISRHPTSRVLSASPIKKCGTILIFHLHEHFNNELTQRTFITLDTHQDIDKMFSMSYNKCNRLVNKHAPLKTLSGRKAKLSFKTMS